MADEPRCDSLRELRRTVRNMRYWLLPPSMVAVTITAVIAEPWQLPGLLVSAGALGASWTMAGWVDPD